MLIMEPPPNPYVLNAATSWTMPKTGSINVLLARRKAPVQNVRFTVTDPICGNILPK